MRAGTRLHPEDAFLEQNALEGALDVLGVLGRHHVVGDDQHLDAEIEQPRRNGFHDRGLARADRAAYADTRDFLLRHPTLQSEFNS